MLQAIEFNSGEKAAPASKDGFFRAIARKITGHKLGDLLVGSGIINRLQLESALAEQAKTGAALGGILVSHGAVSVVQIYRKLAEQWCLRASAAGLTLIMQTVVPSGTSYADTPAAPSDTLTPGFTLAAATIPPAFMPPQHPGLFGMQEIRSDDITPFKKWTSVMHRFEEQMKTVSAKSPRIMLWKAEIQRLKAMPIRDQIEGVNEYMNKVRYIEDIDNYGISDYWATPIEFLTRGGDCEDYAIAKYASLRALGFSAEQLRLVIVQDQVKNIPHAILVVYSDAGDFVLDNQNKKLEYTTDVIRYKPIFSINSSHWWLYRA